MNTSGAHVSPIARSVTETAKSSSTMNKGENDKRN